MPTGDAMDYAQLKDSVKEIAEIAASVPEQFRDKCFELLLTNLLRDNVGDDATAGDKGKKGERKSPED
jgi:hypothetical protein